MLGRLWPGIGCLGSFWPMLAHLWLFLASLWLVFCSFWVVLGRLPLSLHHLASSWVVLGPFLVVLGRIDSFLGHLDSSCLLFGSSCVVLAGLWVVLGRFGWSWVVLVRLRSSGWLVSDYVLDVKNRRFFKNTLLSWKYVKLHTEKYIIFFGILLSKYRF